MPATVMDGGDRHPTGHGQRPTQAQQPHNAAMGNNSDTLARGLPATPTLRPRTVPRGRPGGGTDLAMVPNAKVQLGTPVGTPRGFVASHVPPHPGVGQPGARRTQARKSHTPA